MEHSQPEILSYLQWTTLIMGVATPTETVLRAKQIMCTGEKMAGEVGVAISITV